MPPKKAATKPKAPAKSSTQPIRAPKTSSRKPPMVSPQPQSITAKSAGTKRKPSDEEPEELPKTKKSKASTSQPKPTSSKQPKSTPNAKKSRAAATKASTPALPNGTKSKASATNSKTTPPLTNGKNSKASTAESEPVATKRKAVDDVDDIEAPKSKKSKTAATTSKLVAKKATPPKTAARKIATLKKAAATKSGLQTTANKAATAPKPAPKAVENSAAESEAKPVAKKAAALQKLAGTNTDWNKLKVVDLKAELKKRGLPETGVKAELVARLSALENEDGSESKATKKAPAAKTATPAAKPKTAPAPKKPGAPKPAKVLPTINQPPTQRIDVFVFGEGSAGELGLGAKGSNGKKVVDVVRPRLNARLSAKDVGVVQIAVGGMHCAALTHDHKILTWGVNDQGALGRDTDEGPLKDIDEADDSDSDSDDEDSGLNPSEAEPREVDLKHFPEGTKFASLYAGDSTTFALTTAGQVYGWGTFRGNDGIVGFRPEIKGEQRTPMLIPELKNITQMATGTNHVLALDTRGKLYVWGTGEQNQLGRRVIQRTSRLALKPTEIGLKSKKIVTIGSGDYNSFAIDNKGNVFAWGLNSFGQTGIPKEGENADVVGSPTLVKSLDNFKLKQITGGSHHTIACTESGQVLILGRVEMSEGGMDFSSLPDDVVYREDRKARYLKKPTVLPNIEGASVATAGDTCLVITTQGKAYSWGFSENYQTGQGVGGEVKTATLIDNTAVRDKKLIWGGLGGQFGMLGGLPEELTNGV